MVINFEQISRAAKVKGVCQKCAKKRTRTIRVTNTINPFNKNPDGTVKNRFDVSASVAEQLKEKVQTLEANFICASCS